MERITRSPAPLSASSVEHRLSQSLHDCNRPPASLELIDLIPPLVGCNDDALLLHPSLKQEGTMYRPVSHVGNTPLQHLTILQFSEEILYLLQLSQSKEVYSDDRTLQQQDGVLQIVNPTTAGPSSATLSYPMRPVGRNAVTKTSKPVHKHSSRGSAKSRIKRQLQLLQHHLKEQMDLPNYGNQEAILQGLSEKHPRYTGIIRALPLVAKCIPDNLKKELMAKTNSDTMKLGIMLIKRWSIWAASP
jgi:hypothetical protein